MLRPSRASAAPLATDGPQRSRPSQKLPDRASHDLLSSTKVALATPAKAKATTELRKVAYQQPLSEAGPSLSLQRAGLLPATFPRYDPNARKSPPKRGDFPPSSGLFSQQPQAGSGSQPLTAHSRTSEHAPMLYPSGRAAPKSA